jgi:hypothetical protein
MTIIKTTPIVDCSLLLPRPNMPRRRAALAADRGEAVIKLLI